MARFKADQADKYGGQGGGGFFGIAEDKGVKQVRFMYNTVDDVEGMSVHKVAVGEEGKERYVNCLRSYDDPLDVCPFCREHKQAQARLFIPVYNIEEDAVQIWDRGKTMFQKMASVCTRYTNDKKNLVNNVFEVERNGKPKDKKTTYEIYFVSEDDTEIEDLPDLPEILGGFVLDKTAEDMEYYLEEGDFPPTDDEEEKPARRRDAERPSRDRDTGRDTGRRTPATARGRRNEDKF